MNSVEFTQGRTFAVTFAHGQNFFSELETFCRKNNVKQGYIPMFIAAFKSAEVSGTAEKVEDTDAPVWSRVHIENIEVLGAGTITYDETKDQIQPHIHVSLGEKPRSAQAVTSHLLQAQVQFLTEMIVVEILEPRLERIINPNLYHIPLLTFH